MKERFIERDQGGDNLIVESYKEVSILFADITGFTALSGTMKPHLLFKILNELFVVWDNLVIKHDVEKIKTIGGKKILLNELIPLDSYMVVAGCPKRTTTHAQDMMEFAISMLEALKEYNKE